MKVRITEKGLLIPREVIERLGSEEVEISEESGRLLISPVRDTHGARRGGFDGEEDPIFSLGEDPVEDAEVTDASVNHDRYLYG